MAERSAIVHLPSKASHGLIRFVQLRHTGVFQQPQYLLERLLFPCEEAEILKGVSPGTYPENHVLRQARARPRGQAAVPSHIAVVHLPPLRVPLAGVQAAVIRDNPDIRISVLRQGFFMTIGSRVFLSMC